MIKNTTDSLKTAALIVGDLMVSAAITAPKGSGKDTIRAAVITGKEKNDLQMK